MRRTLAVTALFALACETVIGAEFDEAERKTVQDSCDHAVPPEPPAVQNTPGDAGMVVVLTTVDYGEVPGTEGYKQIGWDLDLRCDEPEQPFACRPEAWTGGEPTDGPRGQDNSIGEILSQQEALFGVQAITSADETNLMQQGIRTPFALLRMTGFNGFSNDEKVRVEWFSALPFRQPPTNANPLLDGTDEWPVAAFDGATAATVVVDDNAYVTGSLLVAKFPKLRVPLANVFFEVEQVVLSGKLDVDPASSTRRLTEGSIGGISPADQLLKLVPQITFSVFGISLCTDNVNYFDVKKFVCAGADIPLGSLPANGVCNGTTFGVTFKTHPALLGATIEKPPPANPCTAGNDPINDLCSIPNP